VTGGFLGVLVFDDVEFEVVEVVVEALILRSTSACDSALSTSVVTAAVAFEA
jgi:hypothetical protein